MGIIRIDKTAIRAAHKARRKALGGRRSEFRDFVEAREKAAKEEDPRRRSEEGS